MISVKVAPVFTSEFSGNVQNNLIGSIFQQLLQLSTLVRLEAQGNVRRIDE